MAYITGGLNWHADYNLVSPEKGDTVDLIGWVTMNNESGKSFHNAKIKLMAVDVSNIQPQRPQFRRMAMNMVAGAAAAPPVTEQAFDEYYLYTLERRTTLLDRETQQVELLRAAGIQSKSIYVYGASAIGQLANRVVGRQ